MLIHAFKRCCLDYGNVPISPFATLIFIYPSEWPLPALFVNMPVLFAANAPKPVGVIRDADFNSDLLL